MIPDYKGNEHIGAREFYRRVSPGSSSVVSDHQVKGSPGCRRCENLELELAKSLTRKDERVVSQGKGTEKKMLIPPSFCDVGR